MTDALRSSAMREPFVWIAASLERILSRGGHQQLPLGDPALQALLPRIAGAMAHEARDLDLMHRIDHRGGGAGAPEDVADVDHLRRARLLAAECGGNKNAEQLLCANRVERFARKAAVAVDFVGEFGGDLRGRQGAGPQASRFMLRPCADGEAADVGSHG